MTPQGEIGLIYRAAEKSSLLRMISGLSSPTAGTITIAGTDFAELRPWRRRKVRTQLVAHVEQHPADNLLSHLTAIEQVRRVAARRGDPELAEPTLDQLGLTGRHDHFPHELSGGEQQRLAFAGGTTMTVNHQEASIDVAHVAKSFRHGSGTMHALADVSLSVKPGELVAMSGPSGSGKSTLLNILLGWQTCDEGGVAIGVEDRAGSIGVVTQDLALFDELTTAENLSLASRLSDNRDPAPLLTHLDLDELGDRTVAELSLGQQQRVAVARALLSDPSVVIADEPTSHQDAERTLLVVEAFREVAASGAAVLVTTHDPRVIELCDRQVQIAHGRVQGPTTTAVPATPATTGSDTGHKQRVTNIMRLLAASTLAMIGIIMLLALS